MSVNKALLIGNLGKDPEARFTARGRAARRPPRSPRSAPRPPRKTTTFRSERSGRYSPLSKSDPASRRAGPCHETADRIEHGLELDVVPLRAHRASARGPCRG